MTTVTESAPAWLARQTTIRTAAGASLFPARLVEPPEALRPWVTDIGITTHTPGATASVAHVPDAAVRLVLRTLPDGGSDVLAIGPRTRASYHTGKRLPLCLDLRIKPGAARSLLGTSARELVGHAVPLAELPGPETARLARQLLLIGGELSQGEVITAVAELLPSAFTPRDSAELSRELLVRSAIDALSTRPGRPRPASVAVVAHRLSVSERQLRNLFTDSVGLSPKHFARIDRARQLLAVAARRDGEAQVPWAGLAQDTGYYDQSHMAAEFRTLFGVAPTAFVSGHLPAGTPCRSRRPGA
ncbi:helix-turn-helix domain-containing protein [Streptomyces sp. SID8379]|uniref:AraC family transcriptional regulator n=1 Tax=unclassified Streptomyces TaxID=2593676 RepID=UPI0003740E50|nr:helix-turn-helix domain-containing protein [Streptomyces sp. HmicA12]MYW66693.1 helix-turn-helix domain-containing protein [Streptomyces sp. SID8379]